jgi:hypothetical protein
MTRPDWVPEGIDTAQPSAARIYDYWLGGTHNFAVDREIARAVTEAVPDAALMMQANRAFLRRAVSFLIDQGVRQFLDLGSGIPTLGNVHEVAQKGASDRVDPVRRAHPVADVEAQVAQHLVHVVQRERDDPRAPAVVPVGGDVHDGQLLDHGPTHVRRRRRRHLTGER